MRIEMLNKLARKKIFTIDEATKITGIGKTVSLRIMLLR